MAMTTVSIKVPEDMAEYTVSGNEKNEKTDPIRNAMILYPLYSERHHVPWKDRGDSRHSLCFVIVVLLSS